MLKNRRNTLVVVIVAAIIVAALGVGLLLGRTAFSPEPEPQQETQTFQSVEIKHPDPWGEESINENEYGAGVIAKFSRENPDASMIIRTDSNQDHEKIVLQKELEEIEKSLEESVTGFELIESKITKVGGVESVSVEYKRLQDGDLYRNKMIIMPVKDVAFYLVYSALETDFEGIEHDITDINQNFVNYLSDNKII